MLRSKGHLFERLCGQECSMITDDIWDRRFLGVIRTISPSSLQLQTTDLKVISCEIRSSTVIKASFYVVCVCACVLYCLTECHI